MPKALTDLQERIIARLLSMPVTQTLYLKDGHVNSINNMKKKGFLDEHAFCCLQTQHLTDAGRTAFFFEHGDVFAIEDIYDNCWIIFEDRKVIAKPRNEANAKRIVAALKVLRNQELATAA
jgi:hypothetical protein